MSVVWPTIKALAGAGASGAVKAAPYAALAGLPAYMAYDQTRAGNMGAPRGMTARNLPSHPLGREIALDRAYGIGGGLSGLLAGLGTGTGVKGKAIAGLAGLLGGTWLGGQARELIHGRRITPEHFGFGAAYKPSTNTRLFAKHTGVGQ